MTRDRPQRLVHPCPPGALLKRVEAAAPTPRPWRKDASDQDPDYLALVRTCPCLNCGMEPTEAAHVRMASAAFGKASGMQKRPEDRWALPLCASCHRLAQRSQHSGSEHAFWDGIGINPLLVCVDLYARREDLVAMRAVIFVAISQRSKT